MRSVRLYQWPPREVTPYCPAIFNLSVLSKILFNDIIQNSFKNAKLYNILVIFCKSGNAVIEFAFWNIQNDPRKSQELVTENMAWRGHSDQICVTQQKILSFSNFWPFQFTRKVLLQKLLHIKDFVYFCSVVSQFCYFLS